MTHQDAMILEEVSKRFAGRGIAANGTRSDFRVRLLAADARDGKIMNWHTRNTNAWFAAQRVELVD